MSGQAGFFAGFTRAERAAVLMLSALLLAGTGVRLYRARRPVERSFDAQAYFAALDKARADQAAAARQQAAQAAAEPVPAAPVSVPAEPAVVDINTAGAAALQSLPRIGPAMAGKIIAHRREHGPFTSVDGLLDVKGIGPKTLARFRGRVTAGGAR